MFVLFTGILNIVEKQPLAYERDLLLLFFLFLCSAYSKIAVSHLRLICSQNCVRMLTDKKLWVVGSSLTHK